uniref:Uncharacterized protein n=1 Tax=Candidatus Kentrum sp. DK TaxID=2126562 RepID=A0A450SXP2_9GAMM|nr:MAG: hypothetical protein BECKDK2373C_GA0170839_106819 [Candidatus Kentron sp. DK]
MEKNQKQEHFSQSFFDSLGPTPTNLERLRSQLASNSTDPGQTPCPADEWRELKDKIDQGQAFPWFLRQQ